MAVVKCILTPIYEEEFRSFSYGFRPKRSAHNALDALAFVIERRKVNYIVDADIRKFFDMVDQGWLIRFLEHRIGDKRVIRLITKWLKAGVLVEGQRQDSEVGTPQGAVISPILANIYLHYVLDLWVQKRRKSRRSEGEVYIVRYADDFVVCFQYRREAKRFLRELHERLKKFGLSLHPGKTRLIKFGRFAGKDRKRRGEGRPETFDFLGFTHYCRRTRKGQFGLGRKPIAKRMARFLKRIKKQLIRRMHRKVGETGIWLGQVLKGWLNYYAVPTSFFLSQALFRTAPLDLDARPAATIPKGSHIVGRHAQAHCDLLAGVDNPTPMAGCTIFRHARRRNPREEPDALTRTSGSVRGARGDLGPYRARRGKQVAGHGSLANIRIYEVVLIENQLQTTDHSQLGQLLTYAVGLEAVIIIWIARHVTDEHRATLDWLNKITDQKFSFFGLEAELWRIGESQSAPRFNIVSKPNNWSRTVIGCVRNAAGHGATGHAEYGHVTSFVPADILQGRHRYLTDMAVTAMPAASGLGVTFDNCAGLSVSPAVQVW